MISSVVVDSLYHATQPLKYFVHFSGRHPGLQNMYTTHILRRSAAERRAICGRIRSMREGTKTVTEGPCKGKYAVEIEPVLITRGAEEMLCGTCKKWEPQL